MCTRLAVGGDDGPIIRQRSNAAGSHVYHGLDREGHAGFELRTRAWTAKIGHLRLFMQVTPDTMADEFANHIITVRNDFVLNKST